MPLPLTKISVLIAGAGLAGLAAARDLSRKGAAVTVIDARSRVGGRVHTVRDAFRHRQHAEAGADLIDENQREIRRLVGQLGLKLAEILPGGFTGIRQTGGGRRIRGRKGWVELERRLGPEIRALSLSELRWDGAVAQAIGRQSVADWLDRTHAPKSVRAMATAMRGFFLADPDQLSLIALVDQFAEDGPPGGQTTFRVVGGNDRIASALAKPLGDRLRLGTVLRAVMQSAVGVRASLQTPNGMDQIDADFLICAMPASTLRDVRFDPALPEPQREAIQTLKYGAVTKTALQFDRAVWRRRGKVRAFGTNLPIGAVWDGNEEQRGAGGILTLMAGGKASVETRQMLAAAGPESLIAQLGFLNLKNANLLAWDSVSWEDDPWARGGYAYFHREFNPAIREWLARPFERVFFAGEHTSLKWQGYMNGAVESGLRAAEEVTAKVRA
jgi:monoamine oxidase